MNGRTAIAFFVSPHGFGHAARSCAVMEAIRDRQPAARFEVFTTVPEKFFKETLGEGGFGYHRVAADVGFRQIGPFTADVPATADALDRFFPLDEARTAPLAESLLRLGCRAVVCDISPLGIAAARVAGLPSILVENFTWDWVYEGCVDRYPEMEPHRQAMERIFSDVDIHIQAEPVCRPAPVDLSAEPVSRKIRTGRAEVRSGLGVPADRRMVLVSLGGVAQVHAYIDRLAERPDLLFLVSNAGTDGRPPDNVRTLDAFSGVYHPDLVGAVDVLVGKAGYSTIAEACRAGIPFGYAARQDNRESEILERFIRKRLQGAALASDAFETGRWVERLDELLSYPRPAAAADGARQIAAFLGEKLSI